MKQTKILIQIKKSNKSKRNKKKRDKLKDMSHLRLIAAAPIQLQQTLNQLTDKLLALSDRVKLYLKYKQNQRLND